MITMLIKSKNILSIIFLLLGCATFVYSDNFSDKVDKYFYKIKGNDTRSIKNFNSLKILYLDAILTKNKLHQQKSLDKLIRASNLTGIKISTQYQYELERLNKTQKVIKPTKTKYKKPSYKIYDFKSILASNQDIDIKLSNTINTKYIHHHQWKNKNTYYDIYDLKNTKLIKKYNLIRLDSFSIKVGQYKKDVVRVAIKSNKRYKTTFSTNGSLLTITFNNPPKKKKRKQSNKTIIYKNHPYEYIKNKIIIIDPGHGGKDSGASANKIKEKNITLKVSKYVVRILKKKGFKKIYLTRSRDKYIGLKRRTDIANKKKADLFISIHVNATKNKKTNGIETYFLSKSKGKKATRIALRENSLGMKSLDYSSKNILLNVLGRSKIVASNKLAIDVQRNLLSFVKNSEYRILDHGVRGGPFWVLVGARMPNILVELGYLTNYKEAKRLKSSKYQMILAEGIAEGIIAYLRKNK